MKTTVAILFLAQLLLVSTTSMAEVTLTTQQCNDYPFVHNQGPVTRAQVMNELYELEAAGYEVSAPNAPYPDNLDDAQRRLDAEYRRDCRAP